MDRKPVKFTSGEWGWDSEGGSDANIYSNPENCGLKIVASVEEEPFCSFNIIVLFKDVNTGSLWLAQDSGCSCPLPFEDFKSFADMTPVRSERQIAEYVDSIVDFENNWKRAEVSEFKRRARAALRKRKAAA